MSIRRLFAVICCAVIATAAHATVREFPPNAIRAVMSISSFPYVLINGKSRQLSAGARIRNTNNLIEMSSHLGSKNMLVNFTEDMNGNIQDVWILTAEEARIGTTDSAKRQSLSHPQ